MPWIVIVVRRGASGKSWIASAAFEGTVNLYTSVEAVHGDGPFFRGVVGTRGPMEISGDITLQG